MFPGQRPGSGPGVQGLPVAIGSGRVGGRRGGGGGGVQVQAQAVRERPAAVLEERGFGADGGRESGESSGGESPRSVDSAVFAVEGGLCACGRKEVEASFDRCDICLREGGWTP